MAHLNLQGIKHRQGGHSIAVVDNIRDNIGPRPTLNDSHSLSNQYCSVLSISQHTADMLNWKVYFGTPCRYRKLSSGHSKTSKYWQFISVGQHNFRLCLWQSDYTYLGYLSKVLESPSSNYLKRKFAFFNVYELNTSRIETNRGERELGKWQGL